MDKFTKSKRAAALIITAGLTTGLLSAGIAAHMKRLNHADAMQKVSDTGSFEILHDKPEAGVTQVSKIRKATSDENASYELLLEEDFSLMTAGSEDAPDPTHLPELYLSTGNTEMPDELFHTPGWFGSGIHQAGGMISLEIDTEVVATENDVWMGKAENVGDTIKFHDGGTILTPYMKMPGKVRISFKARAVDAPINFTYYVYPMSDYVMERLNPSDGWKEFTYYAEITTNDDYSFGINSRFYNNGHLLVDDIRVERDLDFIAQVQNPVANNFTTNGFSLSWDKVHNAKSYLVTLEGERPSGESGFEYKTSFEPEDAEDIKWQGEIADSPEGDYHDGSHELILRNGDWFEFDADPSLISEFEFAYNIRDEKEDHSAILYCDVFDGTEWTEGRTSTYLNRMKTGWTVYSSVEQDEILSLFGFSYGDNFKKIRFRMTGPDDEILAVDALSFKVNNPMETITVCTDLPVEGTSHTFSGINHEYEYYYTLKAIGENGNISKPSARIHALGIPTPVALAVSDVNIRGSFNANWEDTPKAENYTIRLFSYEDLLQDTDGYSIFREDFDKTNELTTDGSFVSLGNDYSIMGLDDFADNPGWNGIGTIAGSSQLGCLAGDPMFGTTYELYSPRMDLDNAEGVYYVTVKGTAESDDFLTIQGDESDYDAFPVKAGEPFEQTVTLNYGRKNSRLMFYTVNNSAFVLDCVEISQNLKAGDRVFKTIRFESAEAPATSCRISGIDTSETTTFAYSVKSEYNFAGTKVVSDESDRIIVDLEKEVSVDKISDTISEINVDGREFVATLSVPALWDVYDVAGIKVASTFAEAGTTRLAVDKPGLYIVRLGNKTAKYVIK